MAITFVAGLASVGSAMIAAGGLISIGAAFGAFAIGAGLSLVSRALAPSPDLGAQMAGQSVMTRDAAHSRKIVYGRARIGGNVVYLESTGTDNKYLWLVTAIAGHEIDAYEQVWFNDQKVWENGNFTSAWATQGDSSTSPYINLSFHLGNQTTADSGLNAASTKWTDNHKLLGTAYMVVKLTYDQEKFAQGLPNISTVIRGKKVLDPETSTTAWSQNPALCIYDYLRDTKYGLGETASNILTSSVNTAKDVCDQTINLSAGGTQARYTMDGVIDTGNSIKANIENMTGAMIGRLVYSGGKFELHAGQYVAPTVTIDESMIIGEISVQTKQSRRNAYNGVKGVFLSETDNYILADYPAQISSTYAAQDGDPIYLDMPLPYTVNNIRAQRLAKLALQRSRQQEAITIPCNLNALKFKIGDNISVTNTRLGYSGKVFEVVGYSMGFSSDQMVVNVEAIETAASIWDWATSDEEVFLGAGEVDIYDGTTTTAPTNLQIAGDTFVSADGTFNASFNVSWTASADAFVDHYVVEWKKTSASDYFSQATKTSPLQIINLENSAQYNVRVKAVNELAVSSSYLTSTPTAAVDTTAPSAPTSASATGVFAQINLSWTNPAQKDFSHVDVYRSDTSNGTYTLIGNTDGTTFQDGNLGNAATKFYKLKAVDFTGNASAFSSEVTSTTTQIPTGSIADNAIGTAQIADDAITIDQIADDAVSTAQIVDDAVTNALIATNAVDQGSIAANAVTATEIATDAVTANKILAGSITAGKIAADAVTATKISVDDLSAINADLGTITAGSIDGVTIKIGSGESVFKADTNGIYLGNETFANAEFRVSPAGAVTATSATVSGAITATSGSIANGVTIGGTAASTVTSGAAAGATANQDSTSTILGGNLTGTVNNVAASTVTSGANAGATALQDADTGVDLGLTGGSISGITISATKLYEGTGTFNSANTGFYLDNTGQFSLKDKLSFNGTALTIDGGGTFSGALSAASGTFTGALSGGTISIGSSNSIFKADSNGIYLGNATFGSAPFRVTPAGVLTSTSGTVGGFTLSSTSLVAGTGTTRVSLSTADGIHLGNNTFASAPFSVNRSGDLVATSATITGALTLTNVDGTTVEYNGGNLQVGTVQTGNIADNAITASQIAADAVTATEINVANLAAISANMGTITAGSISSNLITGDVTEVYPIGQRYYTDLTSSAVVMGSFSLPAPTNGIAKRNKVDLSVQFRVENAGQTGANTGAFIRLEVQKKSKGQNATEVTTSSVKVVVEPESIPYQQIISIAGNQLDKIDLAGGVAANDDASGTYEPASMYALYYDAVSDKTFMQISAFQNVFSTGDDLYYDEDKFASSGTWVSPSIAEDFNVHTPEDYGSGTAYQSFYIPFKMSYGQTTTASNYRVTCLVNNAQSNVVYEIRRAIGTLENIS